MSPRAACRLESLGFEQVCDYVAGKADWLAHGLPTEGHGAGAARAGAAARDDVITCRLDERVGDVRVRLEGSPYGFALVTSAGGVLLGRLRQSALEGDPDLRAEAAMEAGPSTVRPDLSLEELLDRLERRSLSTAVLTTPEGELIGVVRRDSGSG